MLIRTRQQWKARTSKAGTATNPPPREAFIHHTENETGGRSIATAVADAAMRSIQDFHIDGRGWSDIGYHYVVFQRAASGDVWAWEGRHVTVVPAAQLGHNTGTLAIALYLGGSAPMSEHARYVVESLIRLHPTVRTVGAHRQVTSTDCPGDGIVAQLPQLARATGTSVYGSAAGHR